MKLLLTSAGLTNKSIIKALHGLAGKELRFAFIPTSSNALDEEKGWLVKNFVECESLGEFDIVDISAIPKKLWLPRLKKANVIVMGGGSALYLIEKLRESGLDKELPALLTERVYVGISAGSIVLSRNIMASSKYIYGPAPEEAPAGLGYVDFYFQPHLNSKFFPKARLKTLEPIARQFKHDYYIGDDNTAIVVNEKDIKVVSEGKWKLFKNKR
jgi:dipeptidase E